MGEVGKLLEFRRKGAIPPDDDPQPPRPGGSELPDWSQIRAHDRSLIQQLARTAVVVDRIDAATAAARQVAAQNNADIQQLHAKHWAEINAALADSPDADTQTFTPVA